MCRWKSAVQLGFLHPQAVRQTAHPTLMPPHSNLQWGLVLHPQVPVTLTSYIPARDKVFCHLVLSFFGAESLMAFCCPLV